MGKLFEFKNVKITLKGQVLFENISFVFNAGERLMLSGENGSGKSLLLELIALGKSKDLCERYSGLEITSIKNHSIPSGYISKGRDATVCTGVIDFKFKNNLYTPVFIYNEVCENKIISTIYGAKQDKKDIEILTEIIEELPNKVQIKNSDELCKGEKKVFQKGREGYKVNTFRFYKDNKVKEFINESYYPPLDEIILYGTREKDIEGEII